MAWLRGGMYHGIRTELRDTLQNAVAISDVEFMVFERWTTSLKSALVPPRIALRSEEVGSHVVVDAVNFPPQGMEMRYNF
jgi:hypothetical protein